MSDNGIGMTKEEMEENLGTIARSGSLGFKQNMEKTEDIDIIGQFGVGFYAAFMVADSVTVISRKYELSKIHIDRESEKRINHALEIMYRSIATDISVDELAKDCCLSSGHFSHLFKEIVGVSPHAYMIFIRMEKARDLLLNTRLSIREVGEAVGCPDQNYFSRLFKKHTGSSPSEFRKNI